MGWSRFQWLLKVLKLSETMSGWNWRPSGHPLETLWRPSGDSYAYIYIYILVWTRAFHARSKMEQSKWHRAQCDRDQYFRTVNLSSDFESAQPRSSESRRSGSGAVNSESKASANSAKSSQTDVNRSQTELNRAKPSQTELNQVKLS